MLAPSSYDSSIYLFDVQEEIDRLANNVERMWPKERRNLQGFGLRDGMSVLEFASGPGFFTERLATLVPNGSITCLEPEQAFIEHAKRYLKDRVKSRIEFIQSTGEAMELPENTYDFVIARVVYQFLKDPLAITKKLARYVKPGGRLVITDFDAELPPVTIPALPEAREALAKATQVQVSRGTDVTVGRKLWSYLKQADLVDLDLDSLVFHSGNEGARACYPQFTPSRMKPLVKAGLISEQEFQTFSNRMEQYAASKDSFYMRVVLMACGTKPHA
jgi:ubiquinone/menaquinone biosynthesis C-methylase UbiE